MLSNIFTLALAVAPLVAAHGKVAVVTGDAGGNGTALAIKGAVVPGAGPNSKTEVDTTVFKSTKIMTDGLGRTTGSGQNNVNMVQQAMALSGSTLPQITPGGNLTGTFHIVTTDGAGPIQAVLDSTATGKFSSGTPLTVTQQIAGNRGNIAATKKQKGARGLLMRALESVGIYKRAANVNKDFDFAFSVPQGTSCTGTVAGQSNVCLVKIANSNPAGPFGGVVAVQMAGAAGSTAGSTTAAAASTATEATTAAKAQKAKAHARDFTA